MHLDLHGTSCPLSPLTLGLRYPVYFIKSVVLKLILWITIGHQCLNGVPQRAISIPTPSPRHHPSALPTPHSSIPQRSSPTARSPHAVLRLGPPTHLLSSTADNLEESRAGGHKMWEVKPKGSYIRTQALMWGQDRGGEGRKWEGWRARGSDLPRINLQ